MLIVHVDSNEPAFLRKLKGEYGGDSVRIERPLARPRKQKVGEDEDEGPTYVQEDSNDTISKSEYDALVKNNEVGKEEKNVAPPTKSDDHIRSLEKLDKSPRDPAPFKQHVAGIGRNAKRRLAKTVGEDEEMEVVQHHVDPSIDGNKLKSKKRQKVKLSFNE